jgi:hypothetical protein
MRSDGIGQIILESRLEGELFQNVLECAIACGDCLDDEKELARKASAMLEEMLWNGRGKNWGETSRAGSVE